MGNEDNSSQEKLYTNLNKTFSDTLKIFKYLIYPLTIIFILIVIFWGVDIIKLNSELNNIKNGLDLKIKEIDVKQRETNLVVEERLKSLNSKLKNIDSSFAELEIAYNEALKNSNDELAKLKRNSKNVSDFSNTIVESTNLALKDYKSSMNKYSTEIDYAKKGADQRKKDIEEIFLQSKKLSLNLAAMIENTNTYTEQYIKAFNLSPDYDKDLKVESLRQKMKKEIEEFKKEVNSK